MPFVFLVSAIGYFILWVIVVILAFVIDAIVKAYGPYPSSYGIPYLDDDYQETRGAVLARDGYRCQICGLPGNVVHHIVKRRRGGPDTLENLITVCPECHPQIENEGRETAPCPNDPPGSA